MLKDKKGWVRVLEITEELWKKMTQETLHGVVKMLESAERLLENGGNEAICAGLYAYAVEEYGKLLLLRHYSPSSGKIRIRYKDDFRKHAAKFGIAIERLPLECITLSKGVFSRQVYSKEHFRTDEIADLEARQAAFYTDFTDSGNRIKPVPPVDKNLLRKAINQFKTIAYEEDPETNTSIR